MAEYIMKYLCKNDDLYISSCATSTEEIGNDLQFIMKSSASPSIYIKDISIAGE